MGSYLAKHPKVSISSDKSGFTGVRSLTSRLMGTSTSPAGPEIPREQSLPQAPSTFAASFVQSSRSAGDVRTCHINEKHS